ncbi:MAG TPA: thiopeptide-type bacteriocin biosynthesis protein [Pyrinomonadaceae bacterium]|jgi:thiopeptide-type bacteriocin biosynthesis protein
MTKRWISVHIFYSSNLSPVLADCVEPLVRALQKAALISRYFFIRYWLSGSHIRLRLLPAGNVSEDAVKETVEAAITAFLKRRPALFQVSNDNPRLKEFYRRMFVAEYSEEALIARYGESGEIPEYDNNSFHYIEYEPEFHRYGGEAGVELAEKHFEVSSDVVLKLIRETNMHLRSIVMGHAIQLMLQMCYGFFDDDERVLAFLARYTEFWQATYRLNPDKSYPRFDRKYSQKAESLHKRLTEIRQLTTEDALAYGTPLERQWGAHIKQLRAEILRLAEAGELELPDDARDGESALAYLLTSYVHMTNNRIGVSIIDECYLSYLIQRAIEDSRSQTLQEASHG